MSLTEKYYEKNNGYVYPIYGYSPPPDGKYWVDDTIYEMADFRTVEKYEEYRACGMNTLFVQRTAPYTGEPWEGSQTQQVMQKSWKAGLKKVILVDERIFDLTKEKNGLIGEGKKFATEDELIAFLKDCIKDYRKEKGFYGVQLVDEPWYTQFEAIGQVFKAMKKIDKKIFVHCNLNPLILPTLAYRIYSPGKDMYEMYENYLSDFVKHTDAPYVMYDTYPYHHYPDKSYIDKFYFRGLEIAARVCKKYKKELHIVMQAFAMNIGEKPYHFLPDKAVFEYQKNVMLGFGVKEFSYFTYWTKQANYKNGEMYIDGKAMMTRHGEKTKTYFTVQKINAELQKLAPVMKDFTYSTDAFFAKPPLFIRPTFLEHIDSGKLTKITNVELEKETLLVCELYDKKQKNYMYVATNVCMPKGYKKKYKGEKQTTTFTFSAEYDTVDVYENGKWRTEKLADGKFTVSLDAGYGVILLPYKE